jgi:hypothetical protein
LGKQKWLFTLFEGHGFSLDGIEKSRGVKTGIWMDSEVRGFLGIRIRRG